MKILHLGLSPVKSGRLYEPRSLVIGSHGFRWDRLFGITREGKVLTQREVGELALMETLRIGYRSTALQIGEDMIEVPNYGQADTVTTQIWETQISADLIAGADDWVQKHFGSGHHLVRFGKSAHRTDKRMGHAGAQVKFQDGSQVLVTNQASLDLLREQLDWQTIDWRIFRPNIVLAGNTAYDEDNWERLHVVGKPIVLHRVGPCFRCEITTLDPDTGDKLGKQPLATLGKTRKTVYTYPDGKQRNGAAFGVYYHLESPIGAEIDISDQIEALAYAT